MSETLNTDVLIVGAGIIGMSIARELSRYDVKTTVIEKAPEPGIGVSKTAGSLVYMGLFQALSLVVKHLSGTVNLDEELKTERMKLLWEGFQMFNGIAHDLDVNHKHVGVLIIARNDVELEGLKSLKMFADHIPGGTVRWIDKDELFRMEPNLTPAAVAGLYDSTGTMSFFGPEYVIAVAENAVANGVNLMVETECSGIEKKNDHFIVSTNRGKIKAKYVLNCAGKYADKIADMANARNGWELTFLRSQFSVLDKKLKGSINNIIGLPPETGKFNLVYPLEEGNILALAGSYDLTEDRDYVETTRKEYEYTAAGMKQLVPLLSENDIIATFVGVRVFNKKDFEENLVASPPDNPNFINVLVRMPGFTPAPAIAKKVVGMLRDRQLQLKEKWLFKNTRKAIARFRILSDAERTKLIENDPRYGHVICRCETVTEGEIVEAIKRGARTVQGIQFRTRAGMGRCQRGFCGPRVVEIIARERNLPVTEVAFKSGDSKIVLYESKNIPEQSKENTPDEIDVVQETI